MQGTHASKFCFFVGRILLQNIAILWQTHGREYDIDGDIDGWRWLNVIIDGDVDDDVSHRDQIEDPHPNRDQKSVLWCFGEAR